MNLKVLIGIICLIFLQQFLLINSQFTVWPEMILYPYLMNHGFLLYKDIVNPYFPLLNLILANFFQLFGVSILNLKLMTYLLILILDLLIFYFGYLLHKDLKKAFIVLIGFILLSYSFGGNGLWFELALVPLVIAAAVLIDQKTITVKRVIVSGILLTLAVLIKQNAALFFVPLVLLLYSRKKLSLLPILIFPLIVSLISLIFYLDQRGILDDFINWTIKLTLSYSSQPGFVLLPTKKQYLQILILFLPFVWYLINSKDQMIRKSYWGIFFLISALFALPRFEDFHLQVLVAFSALFIPFGSPKIILITFIIILTIFTKSVFRLWNQSDRFLDSSTIALSEKISNYPSVYLLNSPDLTYFLANKLPPKPWGINFPWYFENFNFEFKFIQGLEKDRTEFVVIGDRTGGGKYDLGNYLPESLMSYIQKNYQFSEKFERFQIWKRKK